MRSFLFITLPTLLLAAGLTACGAKPPPPPPTATAVSFLTQPESSAVTPVEPDVVEAAALPATPIPSPTLLPAATATNTPVPTASPTPVPSPTLKPDPVVKINDTVTTAINVRAGPGTDYPIVAQFQPGQEARVTGRNEDTSWWQVSLGDAPDALGWVAGQLVTLSGDNGAIPVAAAPPPPPTATPAPQVEAETPAEAPAEAEADTKPQTPEELEAQLRCGQDFCVTYQAMLPIWENGGCIGNHSIFITVLQGPPPGTPMDGVVIGDTFNNVEVASGDKGPGAAEITLWMNSMSVKVKRGIDGSPYTSEESYNFTSHDELIPAEVLAANGYCDGSVEKCRWAQQNNQVCRGHYSYRVTFHKFD